MDALLTDHNILHIKPSKILPEVIFKPEGNLKITGRIITDHLCDFFQPLFRWVEACNCEEITLEVKLDYLNSNGTFLLVELLRRMELNTRIEQITVSWLFEVEDEEHYELGDLIKNKLNRTKFRYLSYV